MKRIGLIGGMSWESTVTYYQILNRVVQEELGGLHSARCLLASLDFAEIEACQSSGDWAAAAAILSEAARSLERGGAECCLICTNTMHKVADEVQAAVSIPLLHIADLTAEELAGRGVSRVGLLGTKYTMEQDFYTGRLKARGIDVLTPGAEERGLVNDVIFRELCLGRILPQSREAFVRAIDGLARRGARGVVLGCTEIGLLVRQADTPVRLFDTTQIHARRAALYALGRESVAARDPGAGETLPERR